jgi:predicted SAM-dependent methyltransferase
MKTFLRTYKEPKRLVKYLNIKFLGKKIGDLDRLKIYFEGKTGLEIGGPSNIFRPKGYIPVYSLAERVDGCNFSNNTVWEHTIEPGLTYNFNGANKGYQYIADATELRVIPDEKYDFVLSSHSLEHIANPFRALNEWIRVLKKGGMLLIIVPDPKYTFDNKRPVTNFGHLLEDYKHNRAEDDATHVNEILSLHDVSLDPGITDFEEFKKRSLENFSNRCLHHHVFNVALLEQIFGFLNVETVVTDVAPPFNLIIAGVK